MQIITTNHQGTFHLCRNNGSRQYATTNGDITGEGTLFVDVGAADGFDGGFEAETNVLKPTSTLALGDDALIVEENSFLFLERTMGLVMD